MLMMWVKRILTNKQKKIPKAINNKGYIGTHFQSEEDINKAALLYSTNEPNESALILETSPKLSPMLSAIVDEFLGRLLIINIQL